MSVHNEGHELEKIAHQIHFVTVDSSARRSLSQDQSRESREGRLQTLLLLVSCFPSAKARPMGTSLS